MTPPGWVNVDGSWNARLAKHPFLRRSFTAFGLIPKDKSGIPWNGDIFITDIRKRLPFADQSATVVYASHVLEHLYFEEGRRLVQESFRVLRGGGILRVVVPDLRVLIEEYLRASAQPDVSEDGDDVPAADRFNQGLLMRWPSPSSSGLLYRFYVAWKDFHSHKWMYDQNSLIHLLRKTGFEEVQRRNSHDSRIEDIASVEDSSRILDGAGTCVEGVKPVGKQ